MQQDIKEELLTLASVTWSFYGDIQFNRCYQPYLMNSVTADEVVLTSSFTVAVLPKVFIYTVFSFIASMESIPGLAHIWLTICCC